MKLIKVMCNTCYGQITSSTHQTLPSTSPVTFRREATRAARCIGNGKCQQAQISTASSASSGAGRRKAKCHGTHRLDQISTLISSFCSSDSFSFITSFISLSSSFATSTFPFMFSFDTSCFNSSILSSNSIT